MHPTLSPDSKTARVSRLMIAGLAVAGAGLFAMNAPTTTGPLVQHHDVELTAGGEGVEVDWASVIAAAENNISGPGGLTTDAAKGSADFSAAFNTLNNTLDSQVTNALTGPSGVAIGIQHALTDGWYAKDDGYVFGLFGGTLTDSNGMNPMTNSLIGVLSTDLQHILGTNGFEHLYSDFNNYTLELTDHILRPLLAPLVDEGRSPNIIHGIPYDLSVIQTKLLDTFADYNELKDGLKALLSPEITAQLVLTRDLDFIASDFTTGNATQGMSDLNNLSSDVFGAFLNGANVGNGEVFAGLLSDGGLIQHLVLTWPEQIAADLSLTAAAPVAAESVSAALPDLFGGMF